MRVAGLAIPSSRILFLAPTIAVPDAREAIALDQAQIVLDIPQFARGISVANRLSQCH
jgi:hypothetical protein